MESPDPTTVKTLKGNTMFDFLKPKEEKGGNRAQRRVTARFIRLAQKPRKTSHGKLRPFETPMHWVRRFIGEMKGNKSVISKVTSGKFDKALELAPKKNKPRPNRAARRAKRAKKAARKAALQLAGLEA
jgi:hypothetical protein